MHGMQLWTCGKWSMNQGNAIYESRKCNMTWDHGKMQMTCAEHTDVAEIKGQADQYK